MNESLRTAFAADVAKCEKWLAKFDAALAAHGRDEQALAALRTESVALNSQVDPMDSAAVGVLAGKEKQIELLAKRVDGFEVRVAPLCEEIQSAILAAVETQRSFLQPIHAAACEEVATVLQRHFRDAGRARQIAAEADSVRTLVGMATAYWASFAITEPIPCARRELPRMRALLDGKQP